MYRNIIISLLSVFQCYKHVRLKSWEWAWEQGYRNTTSLSITHCYQVHVVNISQVRS